MKSRIEESLRMYRESRVDSSFPQDGKLINKGPQEDLQLLVELGGWQRDTAS